MQLRRKRSTQEAQAQEDATDDFDDEEAFLNLDDTLQGMGSEPHCSVVLGLWGAMRAECAALLPSRGDRHRLG